MSTFHNILLQRITRVVMRTTATPFTLQYNIAARECCLHHSATQCILYLHFFRGPDHDGSKGFEATRWKMIHRSNNMNLNRVLYRELHIKLRTSMCSGAETAAYTVGYYYTSYISGEAVQIFRQDLGICGKIWYSSCLYMNVSSHCRIVACSWQSFWGNVVHENGMNFWFMWR